ncbi:MAG: hypothetical protein ACE361_15360 [Aureliella sp.]
MKKKMVSSVLAFLLFGAASSMTTVGLAQEAATESSKTDDAKKEGVTLKLARGGLQMVAPSEWKQVKARSSMLAYEFAAPADAKKDDPTARITVMGAGGSIKANIDRWIGQFSQPDGKATKDVAKVEEFKVGEQTVHFVDIPGTFSESMGGGPFAPGRTVKREDYRMLGAIVVTKEKGQYFFKATGPSELIEKQKEGFVKMLKEMESK